MPMHNFNAFPDANFAQYAHQEHNGHKGILTGEWEERQVIYFHSVTNVPDTHPLFAVSIRHYHNLMAPFHEALTQLKHVHLHPSQIRIEIVTH
jgi:hypothetical protein